MGGGVWLLYDAVYCIIEVAVMMFGILASAFQDLYSIHHLSHVIS